jgi:hypothetical protein
VDDVTLTKLICSILGTLPGWAWREGAPYTADEVGIFYGAIPDFPDQAVGVRLYAVVDSRDDPAQRRVQLTIRGKPGRPDGADSLAGFALAALDDLSRVAGINGARRTSMGPLGADTNQREERSENYTIILDNPEASIS